MVSLSLTISTLVPSIILGTPYLIQRRRNSKRNSIGTLPIFSIASKPMKSIGKEQRA